ncbi:MAG: glycosyltransferase [Planctomycetes bacterium]|nr:glycosyltransferase [Planctomycetota bacterium]
MKPCIVFDGSCLGDARPTGVERCFLRTLDAFSRFDEHRIVLFVPHDCHASIDTKPGSVADCAIAEGIDVRVLPRIPLPVWRRFLLPRQLDTLRARALLTPTTALPARAPCPTIATVHELPPSIDGDGEDSRLRAYRQRRARRALTTRATAVIVPSQRTLDDLLSEEPRLASRARVIAQPLCRAVLAARTENSPPPEQRRGLVFVGAARRRKNLPRIACAHAMLDASTRRGHPITWIGYERGSSFSPPEDWELVSGATDDEVVTHIAHARGVVLASCSEGFGLPAFEALACGRPALVAERSPAHDACGDLVATCDPYDVASITRGFERLLRDEELATRASTRGPSLARAYTTDATARGWRSLLAEVAPA